MNEMGAGPSRCVDLAGAPRWEIQARDDIVVISDRRGVSAAAPIASPNAGMDGSGRYDVYTTPASAGLGRCSVFGGSRNYAAATTCSRCQAR